MSAAFFYGVKPGFPMPGAGAQGNCFFSNSLSPPADLTFHALFLPLEMSKFSKE
jgi:hypothetical protein